MPNGENAMDRAVIKWIMGIIATIFTGGTVVFASSLYGEVRTIRQEAVKIHAAQGERIVVLETLLPAMKEDLQDIERKVDEILEQKRTR